MAKKIFKIIGIILLVLILIFLSLGLFVPKVEYTTKVTIKGNKSEVWDAFNDIENVQAWIPNVTEVVPINITEDTLGTKVKMTVIDRGNTMEMEETVTVFESGQKLGLHFDAGQMLKDDLYTFSEKNGMITIVGNHSCEGADYFSKCIFALFKSMFLEIDQGYMDNFKTYFEGK